MPADLVQKRWQGRWALVTGASAGIGEAIAVELAAAGVNLVLTARRRERLEGLAERLQKGERPVQARVIAADLGQPGDAQRLFDATEGAGTEIDLLVNNAGFGEYGEFLRGDPARQVEMVQVNCAAVVQLTRLFLPRMVERRRGDVMIVSSMAAYQPVPYLAAYAATKAFDRILAESLAEEVRRYGVRVSALCPGPTESEFDQVAGSGPTDSRRHQPAREVARAGLEGLAKGEAWVIPFVLGKFQLFAQRIAPRRMVSRSVERMFRPAGLR